MFGTDLNASPLYVEDDFFETKRLQALPSEQMSDRFNQMAKALLEASNKLKVSEAEKVTSSWEYTHFLASCNRRTSSHPTNPIPLPCAVLISIHQGT